MNSYRIRLDVKRNGKVTVTKSAIVLAVRLLEQDPTVELTNSSQEIANWVVEHFTAHAQGYKVSLFLSWVVDPEVNISGIVESNVRTASLEFVMDSSFDGADNLPQLLANLIRKAPCVRVKQSDIDDFI